MRESDIHECVCTLIGLARGPLEEMQHPQKSSMVPGGIAVTLALGKDLFGIMSELILGNATLHSRLSVRSKVRGQKSTEWLLLL